MVLLLRLVHSGENYLTMMGINLTIPKALKPNQPVYFILHLAVNPLYEPNFKATLT
jgi:hypothetical protein